MGISWAVGSILELDAAKIKSDSVRLFIGFAQDRLRLASADPETEFEKDVWDLRVFGTAQAYRMDFTAVTQPWLVVLAKEWACEKVSCPPKRSDAHDLRAERALALARAPRRSGR